MKIRWIATVAVLVFSASIAVAGPHGNRGRSGKFGPQFAQQLNLTNEQKAQIRAIQKETRDQNAIVFQNLRETRKALRAAKQANDSARVEALQATLEAQRAQIRANQDAERERILAVLTPEQRTEWEQIQKEKKDKRRNRGKKP